MEFFPSQIFSRQQLLQYLALRAQCSSVVYFTGTHYAMHVGYDSSCTCTKYCMCFKIFKLMI